MIPTRKNNFVKEQIIPKRRKLEDSRVFQIRTNNSIFRLFYNRIVLLDSIRFEHYSYSPNLSEFSPLEQMPLARGG